MVAGNTYASEILEAKSVQFFGRTSDGGIFQLDGCMRIPTAHYPTDESTRLLEDIKSKIEKGRLRRFDRIMALFFAPFTIFLVGGLSGALIWTLATKEGRHNFANNCYGENDSCYQDIPHPSWIEPATGIAGLSALLLMVLGLILLPFFVRLTGPLHVWPESLTWRMLLKQAAQVRGQIISSADISRFFRWLGPLIGAGIVGALVTRIFG